MNLFGLPISQYAYTTNPNSRIDPSGLSDCVPDEFHDCADSGNPDPGNPDPGNTIPPDPGGPVNYGPGNPGSGCINGDASCGGGGGNFWNGGSGVPNGPLWNLSEMQQGEAVYDNCVAVNFHCDSSGRPTGGDPNYTITVYCGGSWSNVTCQPPPQAIFGSSAFSINLLYPGLAPGDRPVGMNIWQGQAALWKAANGTMIDLTVATAVTVASVPLVAEVGTSAAGDFLFSRGTGLLNSNDYVRLGWAWYSYTITGLEYGGFTYLGLRIGTWHAWGP